MMMQGYNLEDVTPGVDEMQIRQPLGVVAAIVPFNFPAMVSYWFLPYAIACGNTFILKPSERVPLSDRKSTRLNSSHSQISYAVFCLKKKNDEFLILIYIKKSLT